MRWYSARASRSRLPWARTSRAWVSDAGMVGSISCDRERLHAIRAVLDHPEVHMRSAPIVAILALVLLVGCGLVDTPATPTPAPTPTAAPRPTAEPPAAVS